MAEPLSAFWQSSCWQEKAIWVPVHTGALLGGLMGGFDFESFGDSLKVLETLNMMPIRVRYSSLGCQNRDAFFTNPFFLMHKFKCHM